MRALSAREKKCCDSTNPNIIANSYGKQSDTAAASIVSQYDASDFSQTD
jgi:hypothetical protein